MMLTSMAFIILVGASAFGLVFRGLGGDRYLTELIAQSNLESHHFLLIVMAIIFVAGFFIDFIEFTFHVIIFIKMKKKHHNHKKILFLD